MTLSSVVRAFLIQFAAGEIDYESRKRLQAETLASIKTFRAGDRLTREEMHDRRAPR